MKQIAGKLLWVFVLCTFAPMSAAALPACDLERSETSRVVSIVDGDTVVLQDGREVRLVGLQAPKLALGRRNFTDWPLAAEAREVLAALVKNEDVHLSYGGRREDRYGRQLAHLYLADGRWVQGAMIAKGMARVYSFPDNRSCVAELLGLEGRARDARRAIWGDPYYAVLQADQPTNLLAHIDSFQLVEGIVQGAALVRGRLYLNFGDDWREDFTVTIAPKHRRHFSEDLEVYRDARIRVRGWIKSYNGPEIVVTHPEQIEFLDGPGRAS
ncbi:MAG: thermonuclease family protein [Parvibaculaceae bacterium]|nr:thermonuclease family protein [Parvibaculaceae bacterium]